VAMKHTVFFWLNEDVTAEQREDFEQGIEALLKNDEIQAGSWGTPAATEPRPVIDDSYDYALALEFESIAHHDRYQVHRDHDVFLDEFKGLWAKVVIYDFD